VRGNTHFQRAFTRNAREKRARGGSSNEVHCAGRHSSPCMNPTTSIFVEKRGAERNTQPQRRPHANEQRDTQSTTHATGNNRTKEPASGPAWPMPLPQHRRGHVRRPGPRGDGAHTRTVRDGAGRLRRKRHRRDRAWRLRWRQAVATASRTHLACPTDARRQPLPCHREPTTDWRVITHNTKRCRPQADFATAPTVGNDEP